MSKSDPDSSEMRMSAHFLRFVNSNTGGGLDETVWGAWGASAASDILCVIAVVCARCVVRVAVVAGNGGRG
jgi:hypothetical protein